MLKVEERANIITIFKHYKLFLLKVIDLYKQINDFVEILRQYNITMGGDRDYHQYDYNQIIDTKKLVKAVPIRPHPIAHAPASAHPHTRTRTHAHHTNI